MKFISGFCIFFIFFLVSFLPGCMRQLSCRCRKPDTKSLNIRAILFNGCTKKVLFWVFPNIFLDIPVCLLKELMHRYFRTISPATTFLITEEVALLLTLLDLLSSCKKHLSATNVYEHHTLVREIFQQYEAVYWFFCLALILIGYYVYFVDSF